MRPRTALATLVLLACLGTAALLPAARGQTTPAPAGDGDAEWFAIDPVHSSVIFGINHFGLTTFYGRFNGPSGEFHFDHGTPSASSFNITVKPENVDTGAEARNQHLKSADFFDARQFPEITFTSTKVERTGKTAFTVTGDLTMHGVTKPIEVTLDYGGRLESPRGVRSGFTTEFTVNRQDFGVSYGQGMLGDEVKLMIGIEGVKK